MKSLIVIFTAIAFATASFAQVRGGSHGGYRGGHVYAGGYGNHGYSGFAGHGTRSYVAAPAGAYHGSVLGFHGGGGFYRGHGVGLGFRRSLWSYGPGYSGHYGWYGIPSYPLPGSGYSSDPYGLPAYGPPVAGGVVPVAPSHLVPSHTPVGVLTRGGWRRFGGH